MNPDDPRWLRLLRSGLLGVGNAGMAVGRGLLGITRGMMEHPVETAIDFSPLGDAKALGYDAPRAFGSGHPGMGLLALASALPMVPNLKRAVDVPAFHGTKSEFDAFDLSHAGQSDPGVVGRAVYLTPEREQARVFAESPHYGARGGTPRVVSTRVRLENPLVVEDGILPDGRSLTDAHGGAMTPRSAEALRREIASKGHDGVVFRVGGVDTQYAVFDPASLVFDDSLVEILRKYGLAGLLAGGLATRGTGALLQRQNQQ